MAGNGYLYAISSSNNGFYQIDAIDRTVTMLCTSTPPLNHTWSGMAYEENLKIMYALCTMGGANGESSLYTIDITNGFVTLIGSQNTAKSITCIAIDGNGQMYGANASASSKLYAIDKSNGSVTLIGNMYIPMAGMGDGMDWNNSNSTMYLATYNSINITNSLRTVNLATGETTETEAIPAWTGAFIANNFFQADFSSGTTSIYSCNQIHFIDQSSGATSWLHQPCKTLLRCTIHLRILM